MSYRGRENDPLGGNSLSGEVSAAQTGGISGFDLAGQGNVRGVFALNPAMTPKYSTGHSVAGAQDKSLEKLARMFIAFPPEPSSLRQDFISSVGENAQRFAKAMAVQGNKASGGGMGYIDFFLTQAQESFSENAQIVQVLSDNYVSYFFGRQPPVFPYSGVLLNSVQDDWRTAMWLIYEHIIRGTQLARRKVAVTLAYDSVAVTGVLLNMTQILRAENELAVPFSFQLLVKRFDIIKLPLFGPTPAGEFPFRLKPDSFANTVIEPAQVSRRTMDSPPLATQERQGASDEAAAPEEPTIGVTKDTYNSVSERERAVQQARDIVTGVFGSRSESLVNNIADDMSSSAS